MSQLARYAVAEKALRPGVDATVVATLIGYVVTGVELEMRCPCPRPTRSGSSATAGRRVRAFPRAAPCTAPPRNGSAASGS